MEQYCNHFCPSGEQSRYATAARHSHDHLGAPQRWPPRRASARDNTEGSQHRSRQEPPLRSQLLCIRSAAPWCRTFRTPSDVNRQTACSCARWARRNVINASTSTSKKDAQPRQTAPTQRRFLTKMLLSLTTARVYKNSSNKLCEQ